MSRYIAKMTSFEKKLYDLLSEKIEKTQLNLSHLRSTRETVLNRVRSREAARRRAKLLYQQSILEESDKELLLNDSNFSSLKQSS
jgi:gluconate kinase